MRFSIFKKNISLMFGSVPDMPSDELCSNIKHTAVVKNKSYLGVLNSIFVVFDQICFLLLMFAPKQCYNQNFW